MPKQTKILALMGKDFLFAYNYLFIISQLLTLFLKFSIDLLDFRGRMGI